MEAEMNQVGTLMNWSDEDRRKGNAWIRIAQSGHPDIVVTVAIAQSPRKALEASGWDIISGPRQIKGRTSFLVRPTQAFRAGPAGMLNLSL